MALESYLSRRPSEWDSRYRSESPFGLGLRLKLLCFPCEFSISFVVAKEVVDE